jgi:phage tail-like protein
MPDQPTINGNGNGKTNYDMLTSGGFGRRVIRVEPHEREVPPVASTRGYLRKSLPVIYQEQDFGMRFIYGLEQTLDPLLALLDSLHAHFDPDLAPAHYLELIAAWFGLTLDESQPIEQHRRVIKRASELWRKRGTRSGLKMFLETAFPELTFRIEDSAKVSWGHEPVPASEVSNSFNVFCEEKITNSRYGEIEREVNRLKPVHLSFTFHAELKE